MASMSDSAKAYAKALILGGAALLSGCQIARDLDREIPRVDTCAKDYASMGCGGPGQYDITLPPGPMSPLPLHHFTGSTDKKYGNDRPADIVDLDEVPSELTERRRGEAQRRLDAIASDPNDVNLKSNWIYSTQPKDPPRYENQEQIFWTERHKGKAKF